MASTLGEIASAMLGNHRGNLDSIVLKLCRIGDDVFGDIICWHWFLRYGPRSLRQIQPLLASDDGPFRDRLTGAAKRDGRILQFRQAGDPVTSSSTAPASTQADSMASAMCLTTSVSAPVSMSKK